MIEDTAAPKTSGLRSSKARMFIKYIAPLAALAILACHYLIFVYAPMEPEMRAVQRIYYFHVPSAMMTYLGFILCSVGSLAYLLTRRSKYDVFAYACAEVGLVFGLVVMTTGPLWARGAWERWWTWEPRLISMSLLMLIFAGYWVLRTYGGRSEETKKFAAVLAVFGTPNIYFVNRAAARFGGHHPIKVETTDAMKMVFKTCMFTFLVVFFLLLVCRYRSHMNRAIVSVLRRRLSRIS